MVFGKYWRGGRQLGETVRASGRREWLLSAWRLCPLVEIGMRDDARNESAALTDKHRESASGAKCPTMIGAGSFAHSESVRIQPCCSYGPR